MLTTILDPASYQFHIYVFPPLLIGLGILLLGLGTLVRERGSSVSWLFFAVTLTVGYWLICISLVFAATNSDLAVWWARVEHVGVHLIPAVLFHFAVTSMRTSGRYRKAICFIWLIAGSFSVATLVDDRMISGVYHYWWGYYPRYSLVNVPFLVFFFFLLGGSLREYWRACQSHAQGTIHYRRARAFLAAFGIGYLASVDYIATYGIAVYPIGYVPVLAFLILSARAIWRYRLVDITPAFAAREIIQTMSEALLVLDGEGLVSLVNPAASALFGRSADDLLGRPVEAVVGEGILPEPEAIAAQGGALRTRGEIWQRASDRRKIVSISASTMEEEGHGVVATVCVLRDITQRIVAEERIRHEAARAEALLRVAARLNAQLDLDAVLAAVCEETARALGVPVVVVSLSEGRQDAVRPAAHTGLAADALASVGLLPDAPAAGIDASGGVDRVSVVPDVREAAGRGMSAYADLALRTVVTVRMVREGERVGRLDVGTVDGVRDFGEDDLVLLRGLADQAAQAISNARLFEKAQHRLSQVEALRAIDKAITTSPDLSATLNLLLEEIVTQLRVDAADILLLDDQRQTLEYAAGRGFRTRATPRRLALDEDLAGRAALEKRMVRIDDLRRADETLRRQRLLEEEFVAYFAVPLISKSKVTAVLEVFHRAPLLPDQEWLSFLETLAGQAALAIDNATLFSETRRQAAHLAALNAIVAAAAGAPELSELLRTALDHVLRTLGAEQGTIWVVDEHAVRGFGQEEPLERNPLVRLTQETAEPLIVEDWEALPEEGAPVARRPEMEAWGIRASLTVPVMAEARRVGGLSVAAAGARYWTKEEEALVEAVGKQLGAGAERLRLLTQIRAGAQQVQQIVDTVPEGLLLLDSNGRVALANPVATDYLQLLANREAVGEGTPGRLRRLGDRSLQELLAPPPGRSAWEVTVEEPERRIFEVLARAMDAASGGEGWVLVLRDVTEERQIKARAQQQDRLAAVGQLAAGIAHDFNNIMSVIALYAQNILRSEELSPRANYRLETMQEQAFHATNLIQQILDFSRRSVIERRPLALQPFVEEFLQLLKRALPENVHIRFSGEIDQLRVNADRTRLQQVLMNLAVNARDAMPDGGELQFSLSSMTLEAQARPPVAEMLPGEWVVLTVSDSGSGISQDALPHLFDPFFTTKAPGEGTGLGLAQVYGIVRQHDGHIKVESEEGVGTRFTIFLPVTALTADDARGADLSEELAGGTETILVAEDNEAAREAVQSILEEYGYTVLAAGDGQAALEIFRQRRDEIDLVLTDMVMPKMGSASLYQVLRELDASLKIIVMTGHPLGQGDQALLEEEGMFWLRKPFTEEQIVAAVEASLTNG